MPFETNRRLAADALYQAFLVNLVAEAESQVYDAGSDSECSSDSTSTGSTNSSSSSSDEEPPASQVYLDTLGELYSQRYLNSREGIIKDGTQLQLLLTEWKANFFALMSTSTLHALMILSQSSVMMKSSRMTPIIHRCLLMSRLQLHSTILDTMEMQPIS